MLKGLQTRSAALAFAGIVWLLALAAPAWAPRSWGLTAVSADCTSGSFEAEESFVIALASFAVDDGDVVARGTISGRCGVDNPTFTNLRLETSVDVESASCESAELRLSDVTLEPRGYDDPVDVELSDDLIVVQGGDGRLKGALCNLAGVHERGSTRVLVGALNRLLG